MGEGGGKEEEEEDDEEGEHPHYHNLRSSAVRILYEVAKCKWYHGNVEDARSFLDKAKDEELYTDTKGKHEFIAAANQHWNPLAMGKLAKEAKVPFPILIEAIPHL
mmetsp:Transcript_21504/g.44828  ORF Transcript_21504/g.44828 Transcript_21504/m.44828 type:complete len:106 (+) Transcript_21504:3-320(+)